MSGLQAETGTTRTVRRRRRMHAFTAAFLCAVVANIPAGTADTAAPGLTEAALTDRISRLRYQIDAGERRLAELRQQLGQLAMALQRLARLPPEAVLTAPASPLESARAMALIRHLVSTARSQADAIRAEVNDNARLQESLIELRSTTGKQGNTRPGERPVADDAHPRGEGGTRYRFRYPVHGSVVERYGDIDSSGRRSHSLAFEAAPGAGVVAPYSGVVLYAGPFPGYGPIIVIEHDNDLQTLLAGFGRIDVEVGQALRVGEPVGVMGSPDPLNRQTANHLHMELREDGKPVDPLVWLTAERNPDSQ